MNTLIRGGTVVTCDAVDRVLLADVLVCGRVIDSVGRISHDGLTRVIDARGCAVIPGLVQAHVHLCQTLMRGMADDLPLLEWLRKRIWPLEAAHDETTLAASADLGLAEAMLSGTTTLLDMGSVHGHDAVMDACVRSGVRAISGKAMMDRGDGVPAGLRESTRASLDESERLAAQWRGAGGGRIGYAWAPRFVLSCTEALVRGAVERAREAADLIHTHVAEHADEREAVRKVFGDDDVAVLRRWGLSGPRAILAHGVQLRTGEARAIARDRTRIVHCPSANLKLGSGIARVAELDRLGVQLALGADGAPCNNNLDAWIELRHAALLAKVRGGPSALPARRAFRLATIDGARALGLDALVGSIEPGKRADLAVVRIDATHVEPGGDVFSRLVYACNGRDVVHVLVDGELVVRDRQHTRLDVDRVKARARASAKRLVSRARM
ncbi:MAG: amidohydrolase family protein [Myxococcota bacterium]|nr:amidohydrolase family protein [Myxococcota bacterium]